MTVEELLAELATGRIRPAYLVLGGEALLHDDALVALRAAVLPGAAGEFNFDRLDGETAGVGDLLDAVRSLPVLGERRLVWLREPPSRGGGRGLLEGLAAVVRELASGSASVLLVTARAADRRSAWVRAFEEPAVVVDAEPPRGARALVAFVRAEARRQRLELGTGAAERLAERVGPQLLALRNELAKAALLAGPDAPITADQVRQAVADVADEPIWDLTDAIGEGRAADALGVLGKLRAAGTPAPVLLGTLASHFRRLLRTRTGAPPRVPPFVARKLEAQAQRYAGARLLACLAAIHETDETLKGRGRVPPDLALERLVLNLAW